MRSVERIIACAFAAAGVLCIAAPAQACTVSTTSVAFGAYDPRSSTADDGIGSITLVCPKTAAATEVIALSAGGSSSYATRQMASGTNTLNYNLYTSTARTTIWGNGSSGTSTVSVNGQNKTTVTTVYGRIPALQNVRAGTYADTLVVTVTF